MIDSDKGFSSPGINANLWGYPLAIQLENTTQQDINSLSIKGQGRTNMKVIAEWLSRPEILFASGETDFLVNIEIPLKKQPAEEEAGQENNFMLTVTSDLIGVDVDLPEPIGKKVSDPLPLNVSLSATGDRTQSTVSLGQLAHLLMERENGELTSALLRHQTEP